MTKTLLTGGSGFIATHILDLLLKKGHSVVTTVRSEEKAVPIRAAYSEYGSKLKVVIVPDVAQANAFDEVVREPGLEVVLHTASPFHFRVRDLQRDLIDPAVIGTTGILNAIAEYAPNVRRVVVTSSFAAISDAAKSTDSTVTFTEQSWNPVTLADVTGVNNTSTNATNGYRASKTLAERAAWNFVSSKKPSFDLVTVNPPLVFGPVVHHLANGLTAINTSNERIRDIITGAWKSLDKLPDLGTSVNYVDVRDVAAAHVAGIEKPDLSGHRLFTTAGQFDNRSLVDIIRKNFPEYSYALPGPDVLGGEKNHQLYHYDNSETTKLLGISWIQLEESVVDTVKSLKPHHK